MVAKAGELNGGRQGRVLESLEQCPPQCPIHQGDGQRWPSSFPWHRLQVTHYLTGPHKPPFKQATSLRDDQVHFKGKKIKQLCWALNLPVRTTIPSEKLSCHLPAVQMTIQIRRMLTRHNIKRHWTAFQDCQLPFFCEGQPAAEDPRCIQHPMWMWSGLHWVGMLVHWGQGDWIPKTHLAWTTWQVSSGQAQMQPWPSTSKSTIKPCYMAWPSGRWFETKLRPNNMNAEDGLTISGSYKSLYHSLRECRRPSKMVK